MDREVQVHDYVSDEKNETVTYITMTLMKKKEKYTYMVLYKKKQEGRAYMVSACPST